MSATPSFVVQRQMEQRQRVIKRFLTIAPSDRRLLLEAAVLLFSMRLALDVLPFQVILARVGFYPRSKSSRAVSDGLASSVSLAIARASRAVPRTACLAQALTGAIMLGRRGCPTRLCIGVAKQDDEFGAHAWVEMHGRAVMGSGTGFSKILVLPEAAS